MFGINLDVIESSKCNKLMFKMTGSGKYHGHFIFVAIVDAQLVLNGSSRLDHRADTGPERRQHFLLDAADGQHEPAEADLARP